MPNWPKVQAPPTWGIEPVPDAVRKLRGFDLAVLWCSLGVGLLVMEAGALLQPLGLSRALAAILLGSLVGVAMLALAGRIGAIEGVPTMVLLRPVLGVRGSYLPSLANVLQLVGWTAFELWIMGLAASQISQQLFGRGGLALWVVLFGLFSLLLALGGPLAVVRQWLEKFGIWAMLAASAYLTYRLLGRFELASLSTGSGADAPFWPAVDLVIAMPVSWLPLVADYSRFGQSGRSAFAGTFAGYLIANIWFYTLGLLFVLSTPGGAAATGSELIVAMLALAGGALALMLILVDETDNVFADIYSAAISLQNVFPRLRQRALLVTVAVVGMLLASTVEMADYVNFLYAIGALFVPLFALLLADYHVVRGGRAYDQPALFRSAGTYWFRGGFRPLALGVWLLGVLAYEALLHADALAASQPGLSWLPRITVLGSSLPAFTITFGLYIVAYRLCCWRLERPRQI